MSPAAAAKDLQPYTASCNPPRKAKRPRLQPDLPGPPAHNQAQRRPQLLPRDDHPPRLDDSPDQDSSDEEDDYDPGQPAPPPKRRGRKPGPMSRSARESQRKLNHSRIEKARRTKINETLATLSALVSDADTHKPADPAPDKKETKGEKEFKLDVLVKTVSYIEDLLHKVHALELKLSSQTCARCSSASSSASPRHTSPGGKRKRADIDMDDSAHPTPSQLSAPATAPADDSFRNHSPRSVSHDFPPPPVPTRRFTSASPRLLPMSSSSASPCLPPISSWLPHPYLDPSSISTMSSPDLSGGPLPGMNPSSHLPTPPLSGTFRVPLSHTTQTLPALSLPGPAHPSLSSSFSTTSHASLEQKAQDMRIAMPARRPSTVSVGKGVSLSPTVSPSWTPEDETAASLLLQMSSSPSSSGSVAGLTPRLHRRSLSNVNATAMDHGGSSSRPRVGSTSGAYTDVRAKEAGLDKGRRSLHAETPSSLLGIGPGNGGGGGSS